MALSERIIDLPAILGGVPVRPEGPPDWPLADPDVEQVLRELAASGEWGRYHGRHVQAIIARLSGILGISGAILTSSGTAAIELALRGLRIGPGDEVLMAAYDFKANFTNVALLGATPVLVDIDQRTGQLDVGQLERAISPQTKAIIASHLHGALVEMPRLMELAQSTGLPVIEDACQMTPANIFGRPAGTWGDVGVFSFGGSKLITAGRGGAIVTRRDDICQRIRLYTQRGNDAYPLSEMQAAVLLPQIEKLDKRREQRQLAARALTAALRDRDCLTPLCDHLSLPSPPTPGEADYYKLGFWYNADALGRMTRDQFCAAMRAEGIPLDPGFRSLHRIHARGRFRSSGPLPIADAADEAMVTLHHPLLVAGPLAARQFMAALEKIETHAELIRQL